MQISAGEIADILNGTVEGNPDVIITQPSKIEEGVEGSISFLANPKYESYVYKTEASALLVGKDFQPAKPVAATLIRVDNVYQSIGMLLEKFGAILHPVDGISGLASVSPQSDAHNSVSIGAFTVVEAGVSIGQGTKIYPQVYIGRNVSVGKDVLIYPGVKIYHDCVIGDRCILHANAVIGSDGFGFSRDGEGRFEKISQIGNVVIEDRVEIGAGTVIDRATMGSTIIRSGVKLDNLIQVAHNVEIGENTAVAAQAGISGSTKIGRDVLIGGQAGIIGHLVVPDKVQIQAQSGVTDSKLEPAQRLFGSPAIDYQNYLRSYAAFKKLPEILQQIRALEKKVKQLNKKASG